MKSTTQLPALLTLLSFSLNAAADNCIKLTGNKGYTWKADGAFSGSGKIDGKQHCFPAGAGGISIGAPHAPAGSAGNTRIECSFPENETDAEFYNCNISLVDGFSAAVMCSVAGGGWPNSNNDTQPIGCGYNLMKDCPAEAYDDGCKCCKNHAGAHAESADAVDPVFRSCKDSDEYANSAEIYYNMVGAFKFKASDLPLNCKVSAGKTPSVKVRREEFDAAREAEQQLQKEKREESSAHGHAHQHGALNHIHRLRARDLMEVVT